MPRPWHAAQVKGAKNCFLAPRHADAGCWPLHMGGAFRRPPSGAFAALS